MIPSLSKAELRKILLSRRRQITLPERTAAAENAATILLENPIFQKAQEIACYYPFNNEFDCLPMIETIWQTKKNCYLPIVTEAQLLKFVLYQETTFLQPNRYNIPEPINDTQIPPEKLDLVLLPLLAFDAQGNRLGMGAGYYDRTFQALDKPGKPFLLGVGYEAQEVAEIPVDEWDIRLDGIITDKKILFFN